MIDSTSEHLAGTTRDTDTIKRLKSYHPVLATRRATRWPSDATHIGLPLSLGHDPIDHASRYWKSAVDLVPGCRRNGLAVAARPYGSFSGRPALALNHLHAPAADIALEATSGQAALLRGTSTCTTDQTSTLWGTLWTRSVRSTSGPHRHAVRARAPNISLGTGGERIGLKERRANAAYSGSVAAFSASKLLQDDGRITSSRTWPGNPSTATTGHGVSSARPTPPLSMAVQWDYVSAARDVDSYARPGGYRLRLAHW